MKKQAKASISSMGYIMSKRSEKAPVVPYFNLVNTPSTAPHRRVFMEIIPGSAFLDPHPTV